MWQGQSYGDATDANKPEFDLGAFVGDLTAEEDASRYSFFHIDNNLCFSLCGYILPLAQIKSQTYFFRDTLISIKSTVESNYLIGNVRFSTPIMSQKRKLGS